MPSTRKQNHKKIIIRMYRFLDLSWVQILTGSLTVDASKRVVKIIYENSNNDHLIPQCTPTQIQGSKTNQKQIQILFSLISKVQQDQFDKKIVYFWIGVDPLSLSCLTEQDAREVSQLLELVQDECQINENEQDGEQLSINFIKHCLTNNPSVVSMMFNNNKAQIADILLKQNINEVQNQEEKEVYFLLFKTAIRFGGKQIILKLIEADNFKTLLTALSWNPFNDKNFDYHEQYLRLVNFNNSLQINNSALLSSYEENAKIKFLRDVATCMFIEIDTERIFSNIINANNQNILSILSNSQKTLQDIVNIAQADPKTFINIFIQIWETFKFTITDFENKNVKQDFVQKIIQKDIHNLALKTVSKVIQSTLEGEIQKQQIRFHQKWIQAFNPFLSFNWQFSQRWICSSKDQNSLLAVIFKLFTICNDDGLMQTILQFIKWFIEPSDNRLKMQPKFICFVYNEFVSKIWQVLKQSGSRIELYVDFIIKIYRTEYIRTRRILIQNKVMEHLEKQMKKKSILICIIKLLDAFLEAQNLDVFIYLRNHLLFKQLKEEYLRNKSSPNIINSCFKSMLKKIHSIQSKQTLKYFHQVFETALAH